MPSNSTAIPTPLWLARTVGPWLLVFLLSTPTWAQEEADPPAEQRQDAAFPHPFEVTTHLRALENAAAETESAVESLSNVEDFRTELDVLRIRLDELRELTELVLEAEYMGPDRIARLRDQALAYEQRLEALREQTIERVSELDGLRSSWLQRREFWHNWIASLQGDPRLVPILPQFQRAIQHIDAVIPPIDAVIPSVLAVQDEATALRAEADARADQLTAIRAGRRQALLDRAQPILFSPTHLRQVQPSIAEWQPLEAIRPGAHVAFLRTHLTLLLMHLALGISLMLISWRLALRSLPEGAWSGLLLRPRALAIFSSTALLAPHYAFAPPLWDVAIWILLSASGAVLATRLIKQAALRRMVYFFAGLYPAFLLAEAMQTPPAIFRPLLAAFALAGIAWLGTLALRERKESPRDRWVLWPLVLGSLMWLAVLLAEVLGFYLLARWMLHGTVRTAYVVFVAVFLLVLARGAIGTIVRQEGKGKLAFLGTIGVPVVRQFLRVFQLVLATIAILHILNIWELAPSPAETWGLITGVGFTVAGINVQLGRILMAAVLVYLAISFSWFLRTFARSEVYPRWEFERGVGDSINTLLHYVLITVGFFIALSALGVQLRNFAIIAGALSVGIGFGLQNVVNNFVSGLILLFERPVRVGDTIKLDTELGIVSKIGLRSTTVITLDQAEVIVPNADLISEKVTNWTLTNAVARAVIPVGVAYGTNISKVLEILTDEAGANPDVLPDPKPMVLFTEFADSSLEFEVRVWVRELRLRPIVRSAMLAEIDRRFREEGIEIPFPQRDLHIRSVDASLLETAKRAKLVEKGLGSGEGD